MYRGLLNFYPSKEGTHPDLTPVPFKNLIIIIMIYFVVITTILSFLISLWISKYIRIKNKRILELSKIYNLLQLLYHNLYLVHEADAGLCFVINSLIMEGRLSVKNGKILKKYLEENKPKITGYYWFEQGEIAPRKEFLDKLMLNIKKELK